ncbi:TetR/AcrR family transcriptional regulator [Pedobacter sp. PAMC26386]|nr:TetR/AcrR family transcriptional regulator [Pedobacter sp. PAMC26386]
MNKAALTRQAILRKSFEIIYRKGYQSTSIDEIIATMQVTKGAFFYHFKNKEEMGLSLIKEVMLPNMHAIFIEPLTATADPLSVIYEMINGLLSDIIFFDVRYGCPAMNLVEEMAPISESFCEQLNFLVKEWQIAIENCLEEGKKTGVVNLDTHVKQVALFITSGYAGIRNAGKIFGIEAYTCYLKELKRYLDQLR